MSHLLLKPGFGPVTPEGVLDRCPNWAYVGFDVKTLAAGERHAAQTGESELIIVILSGMLTASVDGAPMGQLGRRISVHGREKAWALYVPGEADWEIEAASDLEIA
ncbi:MAG: 5-deoxy-glucuronate isomerase, partial [Pseudomonadota bacterium]